MSRAWFALMGLLTVSVLGYYMFHFGNPEQAAKVYRDRKRVAAIASIVGSVNSRFNGSQTMDKWKPLPEELDWETFGYPYDRGDFFDPLTNELYLYKRVSSTRYQIGVRFELTRDQFHRFSQGRKVTERIVFKPGEISWMEFRVNESADSIGGVPDWRWY